MARCSLVRSFANFSLQNIAHDSYRNPVHAVSLPVLVVRPRRGGFGEKGFGLASASFAFASWDSPSVSRYGREFWLLHASTLLAL